MKERFANMILAVLSMDDRSAMNYIKDLHDAYRGEAAFREALYEARAAVLARFAPFLAASRLHQLLSVMLTIETDGTVSRVTEQDVWDAFVKGKSGEARVLSAFRLLLILNKVGWYNKAAELATDMLSKIDAVSDVEKRIDYTTQLGFSLALDTHIAVLVSSQSWTDVKALIQVFDIPATEIETPLPDPGGETEQETAIREAENTRRAYVKSNREARIQKKLDSWGSSVQGVEANANAPETSAELDAAATIETDPERKLHLLRKAHKLSLT